MRARLATLLSVKERFLERKLVFSLIFSLVGVLIIFSNAITLRLFIVGFAALIAYLLVNGEVLGKVFFADEERFVRFGFGLFLFIVLMTFTGILALVIFRTEIWHMFGLIFATLATFLLSAIFGYGKSQNRDYSCTWPDDLGRELFFRNRYILLVYGSYIVFLISSLFILLDTRSGWIKGPIWNVIPPVFLQTYFIATAFLLGIVLLPGKISVKLIFIGVHSALSLSFLGLVLYPGIIWYDPWYEMAKAREVLYLATPVLPQNIVSLGLLRAVNAFIRGLGDHILLGTFTEVLGVDMYWVFAFFVPLLWSFFIPLTSYKMTRMIGGTRVTSVFAAFLTMASLSFLAWGKLSAGGSLAIVFFLLLVYLLMRMLLLDDKRAFLLAILVWAVIVTTHVLPAMIAFSLMFLALTLKIYERIKPRFARTADLLIIASLILAAFSLPSIVIIRGILIPQIGTPTWNIQNILDTSIWKLVSGVSEESPVYDEVLSNAFWVLGLVGIIYAMKDSERFNRTLTLFLSLAYGVCFFSFRILSFAVVDPIFGPGRVLVFIDLFALPFVAIVVYKAAISLFSTASQIGSSQRVPTGRNALVAVLLCTVLSTWVLAAVHATYEIYTVGLLPTSLEAETLKYIDSHTDGRYVVLAPHRTAVIGLGLFGLLNPEKRFVSLGLAGKGGEAPFTVDPSVPLMFGQMEVAGADIGYYLASSLYQEAELARRVAEASLVFRLWSIFSNDNGVIYVFDYRIPPVPSPDTSEVMAFCWDTPASYIVQNNLLRITINMNTSTLAVEDFFGDLYENLELDKILVDGYSVGSLTSIEYREAGSDEWLPWDFGKELSPSLEFQFRLNFENDALVVILSSQEPSVSLRIESGRTSTLNLGVGGYTRLYMPGLTGGNYSYDTNGLDFGLFYTLSLTDGVLLRPRYEPGVTYSSLAYGQILANCNFTRTSGKTSYDLYVHNSVDIDQWAYIEVWLPDEVHSGSPPLYYSVDNGTTWVFPRYQPETQVSIPIRTMGGVDINWIYTIPRNHEYPEYEKPTKYWAYPYKDSERGGPLPESYTDSGGAQNRILFGFFMPAGDTILVRLGVSTWFIDPLMVTYFFEDSEDPTYGIRNLQENLVTFYNPGPSEYIGGLTFSEGPASLAITQDEESRTVSILITLPSGSSLAFLGRKGINTNIDIDGDGIPDLIG